MIACTDYADRFLARADEVRRGDEVLYRHGAYIVFDASVNRRGTISLCAEGPCGPHEFRRRPSTLILIRRSR